MKRKIIIASFTLTFVLLFGSLLTGVHSYSPENTYTDPGADSTPDTDILNVSIDNTNSFLRFKVELNDSWTFASFLRIYAFISVDPLTGTDWGEFIDFNSDYVIDFNPSVTEDRVDLIDAVSSSNNLDEGEEFGMAFSSLTNDNKTIEFGWKLNAEYNGSGYLNLSPGQLIQIKFYAGGDSDYAPDYGLSPINYTLTGSNPTGIAGFDIPLMIMCSTTTIIAIAVVGRVRKK